MTPPEPHTQAPQPTAPWRLIAGVVLAALIMGLPTIRGGFVGGDDHRLVLDHVLVSRPSLEHALKLFTIVHRDLYQPLPLLTFSGEFVIARSLNLFRSGPQGGAWLFHLDNVLLHAGVAALVWLMVRRLHQRTRTDAPESLSPIPPGSLPGAVATIAAMLFAIHPLNVEVVAWVNGRMFLLSTFFGLCSLLALVRWLDEGRRRDALLVLVCLLCSAISKVRVGFPFLMLLIAAMRGDWRRARFWPTWMAACVLTGFFVWINIGATAQAELFSEAAEHLRGPRSVRVLLALENYFTHVIWPAGLTSYYPTPPEVTWTDPSNVRAAIVVAAGLAVLGFACLRVPAARWGVLWFFLTLADTLPFVPARNVLAADRYLYLSLAGLFWSVGAIAVHVYDGLWGTFRARGAEAAVRFRQGILWLGATIAALLIGTSWYTGKWYATPMLITQRLTHVFPGEPRVWERYGWTRYSAGFYDEAIELASRELVHDAPAVRSGAYLLIGMSQYRQGKVDEALATLRQAVETDPRNDLARYQMGTVYEDLGRLDEARSLYEECLRSTTSHNPTLHRLAGIHRRQGRTEEARRLYEQELSNNPYEAPAIIGLADLDFQAGTPESLRSAERRLLELLEWLPEHVIARINLAHLYEVVGEEKLAARHYALAMEAGPEAVEQAVFLHDFLERRGQQAKVVALWEDFVRRAPNDTMARSFLSWAKLMAGDAEGARREIARLGPEARGLAMAQSTVALMALDELRMDVAVDLTRRLAQSPDREARGRLLLALERFDERRPGVALTYFMTATLLAADQRIDAARVFAGLFAEHCDAPPCEELYQSLMAQLAQAGDSR